MSDGKAEVTSEESRPIVIKNDSALIQVGFAGEDIPQAQFPAVVGWAKQAGIDEGPEDFWVGDEAVQKRGPKVLQCPIQNGIVTNWDDMEKIWHHAFYVEARVCPEKRQVLMAESLFSPKAQRERITQIMFEVFEVSAFYMDVAAVLAMYAAGQTTGVLLEIEEETTQAVAIYEGYVIPHSVPPGRAAAAAKQLLDFLWERPVDSRFCGSSTWGDGSWMKDLAKDVLFGPCMYIAQDYEAELQKDPETLKKVVYETPTVGEEIHMGIDTFRIPEILFQPSIAELEGKSIHLAVFDVIMSLDSDLDLKQFYRSVVLAGKGSVFKGIDSRLKKEIVALAPEGIESQITVTAPPRREYSAWSGGSTLASLDTFQESWIRKECLHEEEDPHSYDDIGPTIIHSSCFNFPG